MNSKKNILLTGATGFLGRNLLKLFLVNTNYYIYLLVRGKGQNDAENRIAKLLDNIFYGQVKDEYKKRINIVQGNQTLKKLGLSNAKFRKLQKNLDVIVHSAALTEFKAPLQDLRLINTLGTKNILDLALGSEKISKFQHVSTAFIAGDNEGIFKEDDLHKKRGFNNPYEISKYEAELLVEDYRRKGLNISVFRPSIVVGDYATGETANFKMFYKPFRSLSLGLFDEIPLSRKTILNLIPVDTAAKAIFLITENTEKYSNYNIVSPKGVSIITLMNIGKDVFKYKNPIPKPLVKYDFSKLSYVQKRIIEEYVIYFNYKTIFDCKNTKNVLDSLNFKFPAIDNKYIVRLFCYAKKMGYIKSRG
jgi:long-chain acyl-CoA synthetase